MASRGAQSTDCSCAEPAGSIDEKLTRFASTDAGKLALGTLGVYLLWRLVLPSAENQLPPQEPEKS